MAPKGFKSNPLESVWGPGLAGMVPATEPIWRAVSVAAARPVCKKIAMFSMVRKRGGFCGGGPPSLDADPYSKRAPLLMMLAC